MQDVTSLPYMQMIASLGPPDYFFTEYFRVHQHSRLDPEILRSITENRSGQRLAVCHIKANPFACIVGVISS